MSEIFTFACNLYLKEISNCVLVGLRDVLHVDAEEFVSGLYLATSVSYFASNLPHYQHILNKNYRLQYWQQYTLNRHFYDYMCISMYKLSKVLIRDHIAHSV